MALPLAVIRKVVALTDQPTRVACCLASAKMYEAAAHPSVWRHTTVYRPDAHAIKFLRCVEPEAVHVACADAGRAEALIEGLAGVPLRGLHLTLSSGPCGSLVECIAACTHLRHLVMEFADLTQPACIAFPANCIGMPHLQFVRIVERPSRRSPRRLEVYFGDAELPALEEVQVEVSTCDILAHARRFPKLKAVAYSAEDEGYEDADLRDVRLVSLSCDVRDAMAVYFLNDALGRARYVDQITLACYSNVCLETYVNARTLHIRVHPPATVVDIVHAAVRGIESVSIDAPPEKTRGFTARFTGVGSWHNFQTWLERTVLRVGLEGTVVVDPA